MDINSTYKKIPWVKNVPEFFDGLNLSEKRLEKLSDQAQRFLVYQSMLTMSQYFSVIPDYHSDFEIMENDNLDLKKSLNNTLPTWLSGLCDLRVSQIVNGLLDILNMKTEYQKWPPKSVMQFHSVCRMSKPPYHEMKIIKSLQIENKNEEAKIKSYEIQHKAMTDIFKMFGKDYEKIKRDRDKKASI